MTQSMLKAESCVCVIAESSVHAGVWCVCAQLPLFLDSQIGNNKAFTYSDTLFLTFRFVQENKQNQLTDKTL
jgi:hypothetical protein